VGAAYVAVATATDAAVLTTAAEALAVREPWAPVGTRFLRACRGLSQGRYALRRELSSWAAAQDGATVERAVLAARALTLEVAEALREIPAPR
jgi:hypothetical protein